MSDHRRPPDDPEAQAAREALEAQADHEWAQLDEPPPTPEELAAAAQLAGLLRGVESAPVSAEEPDVFASRGEAAPAQTEGDAVEAALSMAHLLQHVEAPPALAEDRRDAVEAMILGLWDEGLVGSTASAPLEATASTSEDATEAGQDATEAGLWSWLMGWLTPGPRLALAGAFAVLLTVASITTLLGPQYSPEPPRQADGAVVPGPTRVAMAAQLSGSPWQPGQNPFASTRSSSQRLQRVLEYNSQSALDDAFSAQSQQHLYRLR